MKAWIVYGEDSAGVYFETTRGKAMAYGAVDLGYEFLEVKAQRAPQFDKYAEQGYVPILEMIKDGFYFECHGHGCTKLVDLQEIEEGGHIGVDFVYCAECAKIRAS